jgi:hypothetical protein
VDPSGSSARAVLAADGSLRHPRRCRRLGAHLRAVEIGTGGTVLGFAGVWVALLGAAILLATAGSAVVAALMIVLGSVIA